MAAPRREPRSRRGNRRPSKQVSCSVATAIADAARNFGEGAKPGQFQLRTPLPLIVTVPVLPVLPGFAVPVLPQVKFSYFHDVISGASHSTVSLWAEESADRQFS
jgi:hypothetical protein